VIRREDNPVLLGETRGRVGLDPRVESDPSHDSTNFSCSIKKKTGRDYKKEKRRKRTPPDERTVPKD